MGSAPLQGRGPLEGWGGGGWIPLLLVDLVVGEK